MIRAAVPPTSCQTVSNTSAAFTCNASTCQCACPTRVTFAGDANDPASVLDTGWTGISHRAPIISNGEVTVALSGCSGSSRPCGTCTVTGPIANPQAGAGQLDNRRCTNDTSRRCSTDTPCLPRSCLGGTNHGTTCTNDTQCPGGTCPLAGTCQWYFGSNLPLAAGGVSTCVTNQFVGAISGTANIESGEAVNTALLSSAVFLASTIDQPCPRCIGDGAINDGTLGGTCDVGPRAGRQLRRQRPGAEPAGFRDHQPRLSGVGRVHHRDAVDRSQQRDRPGREDAHRQQPELHRVGG